MIEVANLKSGDVLSESSHYTVVGTGNDGMWSLIHAESNTVVHIAGGYIRNLLRSADQFTNTVIVGKEDKFWTQKQIDEHSKAQGQSETNIPKAGDLKLKGIRSIWEDIHSQQVFTVCYRKADKPISPRRLNELRQHQVDEAANIIVETANSKKGVAAKAKEILAYVQNNPILPYEPGESRILRGYKIQFTSRDGRYDCIDMDIDINKEPNVSALRPVNINTLEYLIFDGVKYELEK